MTGHYGEIAFTEHVGAVQERYGSDRFYARRTARSAGSGPDLLDDDVAAYLSGRDDFYLATVGDTGWPYVQFRGGPPGFLRVLDDNRLGWADFRGNLQYVSTGNLAADDRVAMIVLDHASRQRLKVYGRARVAFPEEDPDVIAALTVPGYDAVVERAVVVTVEAFDWNCPQHITPRFTAAELEPVLDGLHRRIADLEAENARLRTGRADATASG